LEKKCSTLPPPLTFEALYVTLGDSSFLEEEEEYCHPSVNWDKKIDHLLISEEEEAVKLRSSCLREEGRKELITKVSRLH